MSDSPDQIIRKLQRENKKLEWILKQKDKKLEQKDKKIEWILKQKDEELNLERRLRNNREAGQDPSAGADLCRIEVFDGVISDMSNLYSATLCNREEFRCILERSEACAIASGDMPLFRDDGFMASDLGNRYKLRFRYALLMALIRKKDNPAQGMLQAIFWVGQTSVCRYLKVMDMILAEVLPTAKNVSEEIAARETKEEFKGSARTGRGRCHGRRHALPGAASVGKDPPAHDLLWKEEAVHLQHQYLYQHRRDNNWDISQPRGSTRDITLLGEDPMPFGKWAESMRDNSTPEEDRIPSGSTWATRTDKDLLGAALMISHKRTRNHRILTAGQKEHSHLVNSIRVRIKHPSEGTNTTRA